MKWKFSGLVILIILTTFSIIFFKVRTQLFEEKKQMITDVSGQQVGALVQAANRILEEKEKQVLQLISYKENIAILKKNHEPLEFEDLREFKVVSLLKKEGDEWKPKWIDRRKNVTTWTDNLFIQKLADISWQQVMSGDHVLLVVEDSLGKKDFLFVTSAKLSTDNDQLETIGIATIIDSSIFQALVEKQSGNWGSLFIVNRRGNVMGHSTRSFLGSSFFEKDLVKEFLKNQTPTGTGLYKDGNDSIWGHYEIVPSSNLYAVFSAPSKNFFASEKKWLSTLIGIGAGALLIALGLLFLILAPYQRGFEGLNLTLLLFLKGRFIVQGLASAPSDFTIATSLLNQLSSKLQGVQPPEYLQVPKVPPVETPKPLATVARPTKFIEVHPTQTTAEESILRITQALVQEFKSPITAILGNAQLSNSKATDPEVKNHTQLIEKEAKKVREMIDKLSQYSGTEILAFSQFNLSETILQVISSYETNFKKNQIQLVTDISPDISITGNIEQIKLVLQNLINNSIESLEHLQTKNLSVKLSLNENHAQIEIKDSGEGISKETLPQTTQPFFTTRDHEKHLGLGLAIAKGILRVHSCDLRLESNKGEGTTALISIPCNLDLKPAVPKTSPREPHIGRENKVIKLRSATANNEKVSPEPIIDLSITNQNLEAKEITSTNTGIPFLEEKELKKLLAKDQPSQESTESDELIILKSKISTKLESFKPVIRKPGVKG